MIGIGSTLARYISLRFIQSIGMVFLTVFGLIYMIDLVELLRRAGDGIPVTSLALARLSFFRTPSVAEQILPFAVLFGSLIAFLGLSRKLELVIARAAGISVWQFGFPALIVVLSLGLVSVTILNPLAVTMKQRAEQLEGRIFTKTTDVAGRSKFLRQLSVDGSSIMRASTATADGVSLSGITVFVFDKAGLLLERVEAETAELEVGFWRLDKAKILSVGIEPQASAVYLLETNLTKNEVRQALGSSATVSFWGLPATIAQLDLAGLDATKYRLRYHSLLARPFILAAMVIIAASVSLRFFRFGGIAKLVLSGIIAGFVLYASTEIAEDFGSAGFVSAAVASWVPAIVGCLLGILVLLHQEDG
jgi:lipopolysaccharide export system permease protein